MRLCRLSRSLHCAYGHHEWTVRQYVPIRIIGIPNARSFAVLTRCQTDEVKASMQSSLDSFRSSLDLSLSRSAQSDGNLQSQNNEQNPISQLRYAKISPGEEHCTLFGYLGHIRTPSKKLTFAEFYGPELKDAIQVVSTAGETAGADALLRKCKPMTPVRIEGKIQSKLVPTDDEKNAPPNEIKLLSLQVLNKFPSDIDVLATFGPDQRHLQLKIDKELRRNLEFRSLVYSHVVDTLHRRSFTHVETPMLFKSTSEGAREFLVPTRREGLAYALPQSPQQYKQILMASGVHKYYQMARCFRDEDLRADRQPEFTQIDLECAFTDGKGIMQEVERLVKDTLNKVSSTRAVRAGILGKQSPDPFKRMTYTEAMSKYGSDKPDLRLDYTISRIEYLLPADLISKISSLDKPHIDIAVFRATQSQETMQQFYKKFLNSVPNDNPHGSPGIFIYDSTKPLSGLAAFGFEAAEEIERQFDPSPGDLIVLQARPDERFSGGSTALGRFMIDINKAAVLDSIKELPKTLEFLWVTDFPLFTPSSVDEPGQSGKEGLQSTHHPFTSPKTPKDVDLLLMSPLDVIGDHYDLVLNGTEIGGGSRRIHSADVQKFVMERVLKMHAEKIAEFGHLLEALRAGCPPHAGFALGFDRFIAVLLGKESVRDVIAFPKWGKGEDPMVGAPAKVSAEEWDVYKLAPKA